MVIFENDPEKTHFYGRRFGDISPDPGGLGYDPYDIESAVNCVKRGVVFEECERGQL